MGQFSRRGLAVLALSVTMLAAAGPPQAADMEVTIAASGAPGDPWVERLTDSFTNVAETFREDEVDAHPVARRKSGRGGSGRGGP